MADIVKQSELKAVSFKYDKGLTKGQLALLALLQDKIGKNEIIQREDIFQLYIDCNCPDGKKMMWDYSLNKKVPKEVTKETWWIRCEALAWFKSNLGSCIIKGKLLVIPIIDI